MRLIAALLIVIAGCGGPDSGAVTADCEQGCANRRACGLQATDCEALCLGAVFAAFDASCEDTAADYFGCAARNVDCDPEACRGFEQAYESCYCSGRACGE